MICIKFERFVERLIYRLNPQVKAEVFASHITYLKKVSFRLKGIQGTVYLYPIGLSGFFSLPGIMAEMVHVTSTLQYPRSNDLVLIRPRVLGYLQSHVVLKRELNSIFSALFMPGNDASIAIHDISVYQDSSGVDLSFAELEKLAAGRGEVALGLLVCKDDASYDVELCPPPEAIYREGTSVVALYLRA